MSLEDNSNQALDWATPAGHGGTHGEVFTRRWVVELILDLAGYTPDRDLGSARAVEPACGAGSFLGPMVDRLLESCRIHGHPLSGITHAINAFDILESNARKSKQIVTARLVNYGLSIGEASSLVDSWVISGDFLLGSHQEGSADFVVGNPPYIRFDDLPPDRNHIYRRRYPTMRGRSDIFIGFIEMGLRLLRPEGTLGFIVADRWMRNHYGSALRTYVADNFSIDAVIEMHDVDAFDEDVSAYPAITIIRNRPQEQPLVAVTTQEFGEPEARRLKEWISEPDQPALALRSVSAARLPGWFSGAESWPIASPDQLAILADLEQRFPPLHDNRTGTRVGIGLATGADDIYLTRDASLVETDRLLPMVTSKDVTNGDVNWSGTYLVNPWDDGGLVNIEQWPKFQSYLERHGSRLRSRHTAIKSPQRWWRTIDRMTPGLASTPKLLIPEMKAWSHPVLDGGTFYPHHNLYHITSEQWDLEVLGGLLLSDVANLFIGAYCVKMRGGTFRFQAQYLRRIRVPHVSRLSTIECESLAHAFRHRNVGEATEVAAGIYNIDPRILPKNRREESADTK